ncbi:MAG: hypothetical protein ACYCUY_09755 [Acidithiobacillus sp.]
MNRAQDILRIESIKAALSQAVGEGLAGFHGNDQSAYQSYLAFDPQGQRERDLLEYGDDDPAADPTFRDWCLPARLKLDFADPDMGVKHLLEHDPLLPAESDSDIESVIHAAIYRTGSQEQNRHDRIMVDVPASGHRKGGTHALPPELRRTRSAKVVNEQLIRWNCSEEECSESEAFNATVAARVDRKRDYAVEQYQGKYREVLSLFLIGLQTKEIAIRVGKTPRRVRQIINGNAGRNAPGLRQFITDLCEPSPPLLDRNDVCTAPIIVAGVGVRHVC